jgi:predicted nucleic acid-binding protein
VLIDIDLGNRQVFVKGHRLHHGLVGAVAILAGAVLAVHDRKDFTRWIPDARIKRPTSQSKGRE